MSFGNYPFGVHAHVQILHNEGMFNDVKKALEYYHQIFGMTGALKDLNAIYFKSGLYEFYFEGEQTNRADESFEQLVQFVLVFDWEPSYTCNVKVGDKYYKFKKGEHIEVDYKFDDLIKEEYKYIKNPE